MLKGLRINLFKNKCKGIGFRPSLIPYTLIVFFLFFHFPAFAGFEWTPRCNDAYLDIISLKFESGRKLLETEKKLNPDNDIPYLIENYIDQLTLLIGESELKFNELKSNKDTRLKHLEKGDKNSPYYLYSLAEINLQWAFVRIKFGEYFTAALEVNRAYKYLEKNKQLFPNFIPNKKCIGLLNCIIGSIPEEYQWAVGIAGLHGQLPQGVRNLHSLLSEIRIKKEFAYLRSETLFLLTFVELNLVKNEKSIIEIYNLISIKDIENPLLLFSKVSIAMKSDKNDDALKMIEMRKDNKDMFPFVYLDFLTGVAKMNKMQPDAAQWFLKFVTTFKGENYLKSALQKTAWTYLIKGDTMNYRKYIQKVPSIGKEKVDEDKQAQKEAASKAIPNVHLLKARILCDGGYYENALSALIKEYHPGDTKSEKDALEFTYRLARIYQGMNNNEKAIDYHKLTINNSSDSEYYFAANSALQLGIIYEKSGNFSQARIWFGKVKNMKNSEYKNSINQKAQAGIKRVEGK